MKLGKPRKRNGKGRFGGLHNMITSTGQKTSEAQIEFYLKITQGYLEPLNSRLRLKKWKDKSDNKINYQLIDEDEETGGWVELSRPLTKSECYECLYALSALYARVEKIRFQRYSKAEQERERRLWVVDRSSTTNNNDRDLVAA
jgi:hypothetical protein